MSLECRPIFHKWEAAQQIRNVAERHYWRARLLSDPALAAFKLDLDAAQKEYEAVCEEIDLAS